MAVRSEAWVCGRSIAVIQGIPPGAWMFVVGVVCCQARGLCDELITRTEESYQVCVCVHLCPITCRRGNLFRPLTGLRRWAVQPVAIRFTDCVGSWRHIWSFPCSKHYDYSLTVCDAVPFLIATLNTIYGNGITRERPIRDNEREFTTHQPFQS
jgi:hypothetical protein